jgi:hypothetical protein
LKHTWTRRSPLSVAGNTFESHLGQVGPIRGGSADAPRAPRDLS